MKKLLVILLIGTMLLTVGCGSSTTDENDNNTNSLTANTEESEQNTNTEDIQNDVTEVSMETLKTAKTTDALEFQYYENDEGGYTISEYYGEGPIVVIPDEIEGVPVTEIKSGVFTNNTDIEAVKIGNNIREIKEKAFLNCSSLKYIIVGTSVKTLGDYCFGYTELVEITFIKKVWIH